MKFFALLAVIPAVVSAQSLDSGTYDVYFQEVSRQGVLTGCSLVFTALAADHVYKHGEQVILNGNIAFQTFDEGTVFFTAKLGTKALMSEARESPVHFHISSGGFSTAGIANMADGDLPGYRLLISPTEKPIAQMLASISQTGQFKIGFNRKAGGMDLNVTIDTTAALRRGRNGEGERYVNRATPAEFDGCVTRLLGELQQRLSKRK